MTEMDDMLSAQATESKYTHFAGQVAEWLEDWEDSIAFDAASELWEILDEA